MSLFQSALSAVGLTLWLSGLNLTAGERPGRPQGMQWWQRGHDRWYYKDDWKAQYLTRHRGVRKTLELSEAPAAAYAYVWSSGGYTLTVNGSVVGSDGDDGTIEDYRLERVLAAGTNTIEIEAGGEVICEGSAILPGGAQIDFATDPSWAGPNTRASRSRRGGPRGYAGDTHMARIVTITGEQKAKALVNRLNAARRRILDRDRYLVWKARNPREVIQLKEETSQQRTWRSIERLLEEARTPITRATALILQGSFGEAEQAARQAAAKTEEAERTLESLLAHLKADNERRRTALEGASQKQDAAYRSYNRSAYNRLGWVASCEPLDSDPAYWEFDISPPGACSVALAGWWRFKPDPEDSGRAGGYAAANHDDSQWKVLYAPTKWGWERWGYTQENPRARGWNKPYNGLAWYRKRLVIPAAWTGDDLILRLGARWNNNDWLAVNGAFLTDPGSPGSTTETITIPHRHIRFGHSTTLALRVLNTNNIGGIINPGLRLSVASKAPAVRRHIVGCGAARDMVFPTPRGPVTQIIYASALSPGAIVATSGTAVRLGSWEARGFSPPTRCAAVVGGSVQAHDLIRGEGFSGVTKQMGENWLLVWTPENGRTKPRPLLIVLEKRPASAHFVADGLGGSTLELTFRQRGARLLLIRPFDSPPDRALSPAAIERCRLWSRALLRYPAGYHETLSLAGEVSRVTLSYDYIDLEDEWKTAPLPVAPLPMLFSYALQHGWPGAAVHGQIHDLGCTAQSLYYPGSDCGTYRAAIGKQTVTYSYNTAEPAIRYRGAGTLGEARRIGEPVYARMAAWGFNGFRPQVGIPRASSYREKHEIAWFDTMLEASRRHGLTCFVNWFTRQQVPHDRRQDFVNRWVAMAQHCKDLPARLIVYDLINEPAGIPWADYNAFMKRVSTAIRAVDTAHAISVEFGGGWAQPEDADMTEPTGDADTIYQFHFYGPHTGDIHRWDLWYPRYQLDQERFRSYEGWEERMLSPVRFMIRHGEEVMHGEFGISFLGPDEAPRRWLEDVLAIHEKYRMHWNWWNYSGRDIHRTGLVAGDRTNPLAEVLSRYARLKPPGSGK